MLALDVPERNVDAGQGSEAEAALALIAQGIIKHGPDFFGLARVLADKPARISLNHGGIRPCRAEAFTPADGPVVTFDLNQNMGASIKAHGCAFKRRVQPVLEQMRAHRRDFHGSPPACLDQAP
ncbi:hypothetical protein D3C86_1903220 [compost metagenome]